MHTSDRKIVVAIWHTANKGKTETLREIAKILLFSFPSYIPKYPIPAIVPQDGDFRVVAQINGKIIAVESRGDPNTDLKERLSFLADRLHADIIFCSTRTKGDTTQAVENLRSNHGFEIIWSSTYEAADDHQILNQTKAKHIVDLICTLGFL